MEWIVSYYFDLNERNVVLLIENKLNRFLNLSNSINSHHEQIELILKQEKTIKDIYFHETKFIFSRTGRTYVRIYYLFIYGR